MTGPGEVGTFGMDRIIYQGLCMVKDGDHNGPCPYLRWLREYVLENPSEVLPAMRMLLRADKDLKNICDCVLCVDKICELCQDKEL